MAALVVDPSALLGLAMDDEVADLAELVLSAIEDDGAIVPSIFWYEVRNVLLANERRNRTTPERTRAFLMAMADLPIEQEPLPSEEGVLQLARNYGLTVYDASYLDLAIRKHLPLATLDRKLCKAAQATDVPLFKDETL